MTARIRPRIGSPPGALAILTDVSADVRHVDVIPLCTVAAHSHTRLPGLRQGRQRRLGHCRRRCRRLLALLAVCLPFQGLLLLVRDSQGCAGRVLDRHSFC